MVAAESGHVDIFRILVMAGADITIRSAEGKSLMSIIRQKSSDSRDCFEQILLQASLTNTITDQTLFRPLHYAALIGDKSSLLQLLKMGHDPNSLDEDGFTPLMHAAASGQLDSLIVSKEKQLIGKATEEWLLDHLSRAHVLAGEELMKHTTRKGLTSHKETANDKIWSADMGNLSQKECDLQGGKIWTKYELYEEQEEHRLICAAADLSG
ncbi:hypothetical protein HU200_054161 [Digitaria exilis]|uniref:Uncharacterized protein n=1 Tax=Digitaria exilis TaxID=1010633 RepID=A0A835E5T0_9POAL|nr:hypothetical protein HU200_054161 [Digitaria exilis]